MIIIDCLNPVCAAYVEEKLVECFGTDGVDVRQTGHTLHITDTPTESVNVAIKWFCFGLRLAHSELFSEKGLTPESPSTNISNRAAGG